MASAETESGAPSAASPSAAVAGVGAAEEGPGKAAREPPARLLEWYRRARRSLPWRDSTDPWAVWLSEVLLQQTRVDQAQAYFRRLLAAYPTVEALATASLEEILGHWSGLGYYGRARQLRRAAALVVERGEGIPSTVAGLRELPGVGDYTAAAVASIAFGALEPALDGNVERVMVRLLGERGDPRRARSRRRLVAAARELMDPARPGQSNQALIELGALVCRPRNPLCAECPLAAQCQARRLDLTAELPPPRPRRPAQERSLVAALAVSAQGEILLFRRPEGAGLLDGTWEVPWATQGPDGEVEQRLAQRYGGRWHLEETVGSVSHSVTFRRLSVTIRSGQASGWGAAGGLEAGWFSEAALRRLPRSSLVDKILEKGGHNT